MEIKDIIDLIIDIISKIGTVITTILAILAAKKYIFKEVYYRKKADDIFEKMELKDKEPIENREYDGGNNRIFNQLVVEKGIFKKRITYYYKDGDTKMVKVWNLK